MRTSLRHAIDSGDYRVDPDAVAVAILRRAWARARITRPASEVLVPAHVLESSHTEALQLDTLSVDDSP